MRRILLSAAILCGLAVSAHAQKVIMFTQPGCKPCAEMKKLIAKSQQTIPIEEIDAIENKVFADQVGVDTTPSFIAIDAKRATKGKLISGKTSIQALSDLYGLVAPRQAPGLPRVFTPEEQARMGSGSGEAYAKPDIQALRVELGRKLFFDTRVSKDNTTSCASCHDPQRGYSDGRTVAVGLINPNTRAGLIGTRNSPTVIGAGRQGRQFWDGRAANLEEQALGPIANPNEMGDQTVGQVMDKLRTIPGYRTLFVKAYNRTLNREDFSAALASFERTIVSTNAPLDKYLKGSKTALSTAAQRGYAVAKANRCFECHASTDYAGASNALFANNGYSARTKARDAGLSAANIDGQVVGSGANNRNVRAFKIPTLREIQRTGPYMHDGGLQTLEAVVAHYGSGGRYVEKGQQVVDRSIDARVSAMQMNAQQQQDLLAFLQEGFAGSYPKIEPPVLP